LLHETFPIIVVNNSNSFSRQIFTIIHELCHILLKINGVTDVDEEYVDYMSTEEKELEIKCNQFAAEVLGPRREFENNIPELFHPDMETMQA
jgi:Zn-dependent peptidase ImmA (M78 family)